MRACTSSIEARFGDANVADGSICGPVLLAGGPGAREANHIAPTATSMARAAAVRADMGSTLLILE